MMPLRSGHVQLPYAYIRFIGNYGDYWSLGSARVVHQAVHLRFYGVNFVYSSYNDDFYLGFSLRRLQE